jgi:hypothetical protein
MLLVLDTTLGGLVLVMMSDEPGNGGGSLTVQLSGFQGGQILQMDDPGENPISALNATTGLATLTYNWVNCCNDGFVIGKMDPQFCATVDITASTGVNGIVVYDVTTPITIPGGPTGPNGALPPVTFCENY